MIASQIGCELDGGFRTLIVYHNHPRARSLGNEVCEHQRVDLEQVWWKIASRLHYSYSVTCCSIAFSLSLSRLSPEASNPA
ncbi:MAG TPA: hypothetical protein PLQ71_19375, partial [Nitrospira sp.]|nr:hypothetical protein [Nitrospira sp.]